MDGSFIQVDSYRGVSRANTAQC